MENRMNFGLNKTKLVISFALMLGSAAVYADSIDPAVYTDTLSVGESVTIKKTVTITSEPPTTAKLDVMFLMDTTGSMGSVIAAAKSSATTILTNLASFGDLASGTAYFNDDDGAPAPLPRYTAITSALSTTAANTQTGINNLFAGTPGYGYDFPEEGYLGVTNTVNNTAWRPGSSRFVLMFGDASDGGNSPFAGDDFASASAALAANNVTLIGVSYSSSFSGQYNSLVTGSGGTMNTGSTSGATLAALIQSAVTTSFSTYSSVCLDDSAPAGVTVTSDVFGVSLAPCHVGAYDRSITRTFDFDVTFTGVTPGVYDFDIDALVDGGSVAVELDHITVVAETPEPGTLGLLGLGLLGMGLGRRRKS